MIGRPAELIVQGAEADSDDFSGTRLVVIGIFLLVRAHRLIDFFRFARIAKHSGQVTFSGSAVVSTISLTRGSPKQTLPTRLHGVSMAPRRSRPPPLSLRKCLAASLFFAVIFSHCLRHHATSAFLVPLITIRECHVHDQPTIRTAFV